MSRLSSEYSFCLLMNSHAAPHSPSPDSSCRTPRESLQEYGRGIVGGLLFSLPLLYTMEMWQLGFSLQPYHLVAFLATTFALLLLYNRFAGMHPDSSWQEVAIDSVEELGIGLLLATLILWLTGQIGSDFSAQEIRGKIVVEAMVVAIGVSIGTALLGSNPEEKNDENQNRDFAQRFVSQCAIALCGAVLIAINVAPTEEIFLIALAATPAKILGILVLSWLLGAAILYGVEFTGTTSGKSSADESSTRSDIGVVDIVAGTTIAYAISLLSSAAMLWFFGRFNGLAFSVILYQIVVLALPAMLGASAGRLLLQNND